MNGSRGRAWKAFHGKGMSSSSLADGQGLSLSDLPKVGDAPPLPAPEGARRRLFIHRGSTEVRCE